jgi:hypothetical protein
MVAALKRLAAGMGAARRVIADLASAALHSQPSSGR